ncbi:hypothetical protein [Bacillus pumilus]|uniref:hypothetical protein n=1 Tax=Bacillus pumilus TaxID=1408 RepID=UPI003CFEDF19
MFKKIKNKETILMDCDKCLVERCSTPEGILETVSHLCRILGGKYKFQRCDSCKENDVQLVDMDGFKRVTKEMLDHIAKLEFENDQLANHRLDPFYEPSEEVRETVDHIVEEYKDEIKEVLSVSKDAVECLGRLSFKDANEIRKLLSP